MKKNTSAWRKRQRVKRYKKYQNIVHNNVRKEMQHYYHHADRAQRSRLMPILEATLAKLNVPIRYAAPQTTTVSRKG